MPYYSKIIRPNNSSLLILYSGVWVEVGFTTVIFSEILNVYHARGWAIYDKIAFEAPKHSCPYDSTPLKRTKAVAMNWRDIL